MADWLIFVTLYLWAGLWVTHKVETRVSTLHMGRAERVALMFLWPLWAVGAPFKGD